MPQYRTANPVVRASVQFSGCLRHEAAFLMKMTAVPEGRRQAWLRDRLLRGFELARQGRGPTLDLMSPMVLQSSSAPGVDGAEYRVYLRLNRRFDGEAEVIDVIERLPGRRRQEWLRSILVAGHLASELGEESLGAAMAVVRPSSIHGSGESHGQRSGDSARSPDVLGTSHATGQERRGYPGIEEQARSAQPVVVLHDSQEPSCSEAPRHEDPESPAQDARSLIGALFGRGAGR
jgi:hypothetical protein